jgi:peroxiredoxin
MKNIFYILIIVLCFINCKKDENNRININIKGVDSNIVFMLDSIDFNDIFFKIDSIKGGSQPVTIPLGESKLPKIFQITVYNDSLKKKVSSFKFWKGKKSIFISGYLNMAQIDSLRIEGSNLNDIEEAYNDIIYKKYNTPEVFEEIETAKDQSEKEAIMNKYLKFIKRDQVNFIFEHPNNMATLSYSIKLANHIKTDSLNYFYNQLDTELKNSMRGILLKEIISSSKLDIGSHVKDFEARDIAGKKIKLFDFKGKIILLDFWASWCVPCHKQNKFEFNSIYNKYKNKDFVLISYSLDKESDSTAWKIASEKDSISWINISNLKGFNDPISKQYGIDAVPETFIISKEGIIINSFEGYNPGKEEIETELDKIFSNQE